jgi:hypothetical protein
MASKEARVAVAELEEYAKDIARSAKNDPAAARSALQLMVAATNIRSGRYVAT